LDDLMKRLRDPAFGTETTERNLMDKAADLIAELEANINIKADFIDATINQLAASDQRIEELEAKLAKALIELKMLIDVSTLMQSSAAYDKRRHQNVITDTMWAQWAKQLKFARTTIVEIGSVSCANLKGQNDG